MIKKLVPFLALACIVLISIFNTGCKKEKLLESGGELRFSTDTLSFDTVFTAQGSFTLGIRIYNPQNQKVVVSSVRLQGGSNSYFHLNVDGFTGNDIKNIEIAANDSVFVFATVKIDPTQANLPFIIEDKLIATLNGADFSIPVLAYGQNAYYVVGENFHKDTTFRTDKPYVIIHSAQVDTGFTLTIPAGCRVYMHQDSRLVVYGTLKVLGAKNDTVVFQGDRLDRAYFGYEGYPGEWGGIYFSTSSKNNMMQYALLKNGGNSALGAAPALIQVNPDSFSTSGSNPMLTMDKVTLQNSIGYGLLAFNGTVKATNCLFHTCGAQAVALVQGGKYELNNCTIVNYGSDKVSHVDNSSLILLNYFKPNQTTLYFESMNATLNNCVVYGSLENEVVIDSIDRAPCVIKVNHCLFKAEQNKIPVWVAQDNGMKYNLNPKFDSTATEQWNFRPKPGSPLIDAGISIGVTDDLDGNIRNFPPDIGAYERQ